VVDIVGEQEMSLGVVSISQSRRGEVANNDTRRSHGKADCHLSGEGVFPTA
jgi:hypothetical protein